MRMPAKNLTALLRALTLTALLANSASAQQAAVPTPEVVVQRFVDAANARDANAMALLVAPDVVFERLPSGRIVAQGRDSIRAMYTRSLSAVSAAFKITVQPRIVEGQFVIDQEHIAGGAPGRTQATWMYLVRDGLIQRAWVLDGKAP
jgi:uncharacterized protein (TIGR02246 family)